MDAEQSICHCEMHPSKQTTLLVHTGQGCVCLRTACPPRKVNEISVNGTQENLCIWNFVKIEGCDFSYQAPVTSYQHVKVNLTVQEISPVPGGMNLTLVAQLLKHNEFKDSLQEIKNEGKKTLITIHRDTETIWRVFKRLEEGPSHHHCWDVLFGWSPTAAALLNTLVHPMIVLLILVGMSLILSVRIFVWNWRMLQ